MNKRLASLLLLTTGVSLCFTTPIYSTNKNTLTVEIDGLKQTKGQICYSLFTQSQGFPESTDKALQAECIPVREKSPVLIIENLQMGNYALAVFHDANVDGELNRNFLGIPREGFGFSQNPQIKTSPPSFGDSVVVITESKTNLQVQLRHF